MSEYPRGQQKEQRQTLRVGRLRLATTRALRSQLSSKTALREWEPATVETIEATLAAVKEVRRLTDDGGGDDGGDFSEDDGSSHPGARRLRRSFDRWQTRADEVAALLQPSADAAAAPAATPPPPPPADAAPPPAAGTPSPPSSSVASSPCGSSAGSPGTARAAARNARDDAAGAHALGDTVTIIGGHEGIVRFVGATRFVRPPRVGSARRAVAVT